MLKAHSPSSICKLYLLNVQFLLTIAISGFSVSSISHPTVCKSCHFFFTATWNCFPFLDFYCPLLVYIPYWRTAPAHPPKAGESSFSWVSVPGHCSPVEQLPLLSYMCHTPLSSKRSPTTLLSPGVLLSFYLSIISLASSHSFTYPFISGFSLQVILQLTGNLYS